MMDNWFTNKCMALVGDNGKALSGDALAAAEKALLKAKQSNCKLWADRNGIIYWKERKLFSSAYALQDDLGNIVRICGRQVKIKAHFCSKCGSPAPGGWWRCGGCGQHIGNESEVCPHCGHQQHPALRADLADGIWQKDAEIFAERFELAEITELMTKGINVQECQALLLLEGGALSDVLGAGFYPAGDLSGADGAVRSIVFVDSSEFSLPVCVEDIRTADDLTCDLHAVLTLRFDPAGARNFMQNLMGESLYLHNETVTASISYDAVAHSILQNTDAAIRDFCNQHKVAEFFSNADLRIQLEDHLACCIQRNLSAIGMAFCRLKEVEFESEVLTKLREMSGQLEAKRREIEFMKRADEMANDATRREALSEHEMEEYMDQLAHEKGIKDELRVQEVERLKVKWEQNKKRDILINQQELDELQQEHRFSGERREAENQAEIRELQHRKELEQRLAEQQNSLEYMKLETQIQDVRLEIDRKKVRAEQEAAVEWLKIKQQKQEFQTKQKIEIIKAASSADMRALLMAEDDPEKRAALLQLNEQEMQSKMTPELLLAAAAARGNAAAAEALSRLNKDQLAAVERSKNENREIYERMLQMNERMFNQAAESMAKQNGNSSATTQIIK